MSDMQSQSCGCAGSVNPRVDSIYDHMAEADAPLAMAYVPDQKWETPFPLCKGLAHGTIFEGLCKPFCGKGGKCR